MSDFKQYQYEDQLSKKSKILRLLWSCVWFSLFRTNPRWLFNTWRVILLRVFGAKIGVGCKVSPTCFVWAPWNLEMGDYSVLGDGVDCYSMDKIIIGSKVAISQRTFICTGTHDIKSLRRPLVTKPIFIGDHTWVCAEAFIGPGVRLNKGVVVAARSVVVKDVDSLHVVAGNPAIVIKKRILEDGKVEF
jgi:putative colanic acid biosynthesis acetyltransferase WcaF